MLPLAPFMSESMSENLRCVTTIVDAIALAMACTLGRAVCVVGITSVGAHLLSTSQDHEAAGARTR